MSNWTYKERPQHNRRDENDEQRVEYKGCVTEFDMREEMPVRRDNARKREFDVRVNKIQVLNEKITNLIQMVKKDKNQKKEEGEGCERGKLGEQYSRGKLGKSQRKVRNQEENIRNCGQEKNISYKYYCEEDNGGKKQRTMSTYSGQQKYVNYMEEKNKMKNRNDEKTQIKKLNSKDYENEYNYEKRENKILYQKPERNQFERIELREELKRNASYQRKKQVGKVKNTNNYQNEQRRKNKDRIQTPTYYRNQMIRPQKKDYIDQNKLQIAQKCLQSVFNRQNSSDYNGNKQQKYSFQNYSKEYPSSYSKKQLTAKQYTHPTPICQQIKRPIMNTKVIDEQILKIRAKIQQSQAQKQRIKKKYNDISSNQPKYIKQAPKIIISKDQTKYQKHSKQQSSQYRPPKQPSQYRPPKQSSQYRPPKQPSQYRPSKDAYVANKRNFQIRLQPVQCSKVTVSKLISTLNTQVQLDQQMKVLRQAFQQIAEATKWSDLLTQIRRLGYEVSEQQLHSAMSINAAEHNPFVTDKPHPTSIQKIAAKFVEVEDHWLKKVSQCVEVVRLVDQRFQIQDIDLNHKGYLNIEDIVCFINLYSGNFYRNRDIAVLFKRFTTLEKQQHGGVSYNTFLNKVGK